MNVAAVPRDYQDKQGVFGTLQSTLIAAWLAYVTLRVKGQRGRTGLFYRNRFDPAV